MLFNLYFEIFNIKKYIEALCMSNILKKKNITMANYGLNGYYMSVFGIVVAVVVVIWKKLFL